MISDVKIKFDFDFKKKGTKIIIFYVVSALTDVKLYHY